MQKHLEEISKEIEPGNHAVVVFDRAAWHTTKKLHLPEYIIIVIASSFP